jgi:hypothetical protein
MRTRRISRRSTNPLPNHLIASPFNGLALGPELEHGIGRMRLAVEVYVLFPNLHTPAVDALHLPAIRADACADANDVPSPASSSTTARG